MANLKKQQCKSDYLTGGREEQDEGMAGGREEQEQGARVCTDTQEQESIYMEIPAAIPELSDACDIFASVS